MADKENAETSPAASDFIREAVKEDLASGRFDRVHTRFPPEPNAYLHIGHAKAVWIDYGIAQDFGGLFNLRFDDTNPTKEEQEYVDAIIKDVKWLGADWGDRLLFASDYFEQMYQWAEELIRKGKAYVDDQSADEVSAGRGTLTRPGKESPYRGRSVEENLDLFRRMRAGEFPDGSRTLRAKIDMASPNLNLRDPVMYRILHAEHHRTGDKWCIYPMYDWAHGLEDSIEGITFSLCSLEYENHRPLYDWFIDAINDGRTDDGSGPWGKKIHHPRQIEFARLNLTYTVMSKRRLLELVNAGCVKSLDDPRMPTLAGLRRRGYTPEAIREFCRRIGINKYDSVVDVQLLEHCIREDLNKRAARRMAVLRPLKLIIDNYPDGQVEQMDAVNNPEDATAGTRKVPFSKVLYIEKDDFREVPPKGYFRLSPGVEVRLRYAYFVKCVGVDKDPATGEVTAVHCTYDPATRGGDSPDGRKVKATLHWISAAHAARAEVRLYDYLFTKPDPDDVPEGVDWKTNVNPNSLEVISDALVEPSLAGVAAGAIFQFERQGYFCVDPDSAGGRLVFNRTVSLKDTWAKVARKGGK
ncbi:MAG: glutamine--tRNA ligase/YqeY domain fusion protein [Phycisphaerae bacterium]